WDGIWPAASLQKMQVPAGEVSTNSGMARVVQWWDRIAPIRSAAGRSGVATLSHCLTRLKALCARAADNEISDAVPRTMVVAVAA
ncbi:MAG TPA: hypothetical protein PKE22_13690, partial [Ottowia sp.]|nr:hypothetical protein [Ottowia sp.]